MDLSGRRGVAAATRCQGAGARADGAAAAQPANRGLLVQMNRHAEPGEVHRLHLVQRHRKSGQIVGGVALEGRVARPRTPHAGHGPSTD